MTVLLRMAIELARRQRKINHYKSMSVAVVARRCDGTIVKSHNGHGNHDKHYRHSPLSHAEARVCKKLDARAHVAIARVKRDGTIGLAKPCSYCMMFMRSRRVANIEWTE